ncbi:MAG: hypothetical protein IJ242_02090 [Clostridia bacterium]|nr:hypothetical protein [Clostridia bacterium]
MSLKEKCRMYERLYDVFREIEKKKTKVMSLFFAVQLPDEKIRYVLMSGYTLMLFISETDALSNCFYLWGSDDSFHTRILYDTQLMMSDFISIYRVSKQNAPDEQKEAYLAYARQHKLPVAGARPYIVIERHMHNRMFSYSITQEEVEEAVYVLEALRTLIDSMDSPNVHSSVVNYQLLHDSIHVVQWKPDGASVLSVMPKIELSSTEKESVFQISESLENKINEVFKLKRKGTVEAKMECLMEPLDYVFGEESVVPAVIGIGDRKGETATCVLSDYRNQWEMAWDMMLDFLIRNGERPNTLQINNDGSHVLEWMFESLCSRLNIQLKNVFGNINEVLFQKINQEEEKLLDLEAEMKYEFFQNNVFNTPKSYVFQVKVLNGRYYEGKACIHEIQLDQADTLRTLHCMILQALDFDNDHCYMFETTQWKRTNGQIGGTPDTDMPLEDVTPADSVCIAELGLQKGSKMEYVYDFGDWWRFEIKVKKVLAEETDDPIIISSVGENPEQYPSGDW